MLIHGWEADQPAESQPQYLPAEGVAQLQDLQVAVIFPPDTVDRGSDLAG